MNLINLLFKIRISLEITIINTYKSIFYNYITKSNETTKSKQWLDRDNDEIELNDKDVKDESLYKFSFSSLPFISIPPLSLDLGVLIVRSSRDNQSFWTEHFILLNLILNRLFGGDNNEFGINTKDENLNSLHDSSFSPLVFNSNSYVSPSKHSLDLGFLSARCSMDNRSSLTLLL